MQTEHFLFHVTMGSLERLHYFMVALPWPSMINFFTVNSFF